MADTTHLILPLMAAAQAQKHVTHNDAILRLDALVHLSVISRQETDPPAEPSDGDRYMPASGATGAWEGADFNIVWFSDGVWTKLVPRKGWRAWVEDEEALLAFDGADWVEIEGGGGGIDSFFHVDKDNNNQTGVATGTDTKLTWAREVANEGDHFDLANDRWTPPAGTVMLWVAVRWGGTNIEDQKQHLIRLYKNASVLVNIGAVITSADDTAFSMFAFAIDQANGTDFYEIHVRPDGTGDKTIQGSTAATFWMGLRLGQ